MKDYVVAVDVANGKSTIGLFRKGDTDSVAVIKGKNYSHTEESLSKFLSLPKMKELEDKDIPVMMEATSVYHYPVREFFLRNGFRDVMVMNPLLIKLQTASLSGTKTDDLDCGKIADFFFTGKWKRPVELTSAQKEARELSRYLEALKDELSRMQIQFRMHLQSAFPEYESAVGKKHVFEPFSVNLLSEYPTAKEIAGASVSRLSKCMAGKRKIEERYKTRAELLKRIAKSSLAINHGGTAIGYIVKDSLARIGETEDRISRTEEKLISMTCEQPFFKVLTSFRGIGDVLAAHITAELWNPSAVYATPEKVIRACGLNPKREQSGGSIDRYGKITKTGNKHARRWLFVAVQSILRQAGRRKDEADPFRDYYKKKRGSDKRHHHAAVIACSTKLIRKSYYRLCDYLKAGELIKK